jgi:hypothetical protein
VARYDVALNADSDFLNEAIINFAGGGDSIIFPGVAGLIIRVYRYFVVVGGATNLTYRDGATALTGPVPLAANEAMVFTLDTKAWYTCSPGNNFIINSSNPVQVSGRAYCTQRQA